MAKVLLACLGSGLAGDAAAGAAVHALLRGSTLPEGARLVQVPAGGLQLLHALGDAEAVVVVGEIETGARPGTLHVLDWTEVPFGADAGHRNGHALRVTMEAVRIRRRGPRRAFLVGVEGRAPGGGAGCMHAEVVSALAGAARVALDLVQGLASLAPGEEPPVLADLAHAEPVPAIRPGPAAMPRPPPLPSAGR